MTELQPMKGGDGLDWSSSPPAGSGIINTDTFAGSISSTTMAGAASTSGASDAASGAPAGAGGLGQQASSFFASPFASVGVEYGRTFIKNNTVLNSGLGGWLRGSRLRYYFTVSQSYIGHKTGKILFPYIQSDWSRVPLEEVDEGLVAASAASSPSASWKSARHDVNAPDLYIGLMSFLTFIVAMGVALGMTDRFEPEMLGLTATRSLVCLVLEVALIYAGFYLSDAPVSPPVLDLISLAGYKYVVLNIDIAVGILFGATPFWITFVALGISTVVFMVRTLNGWVPSSVSALGSTPSHPRFRVLFVVFALLQLVLSIILLWPALSAVQGNGLVGRWTPTNTSQQTPIIEGSTNDNQAELVPRQDEPAESSSPTPVTPVTEPPSESTPVDATPTLTPTPSPEPASTPAVNQADGVAEVAPADAIATPTPSDAAEPNTPVKAPVKPAGLKGRRKGPTAKTTPKQP